MNCKPGDRAVIVRAGITENIGRIVEVIESVDARPQEGNLSGSRQLWLCESLGSPLRYEVVLMDGEQRVELMQVGPVPDEFLRPLTEVREDAVSRAVLECV